MDKLLSRCNVSDIRTQFSEETSVKPPQHKWRVWAIGTQKSLRIANMVKHAKIFSDWWTVMLTLLATLVQIGSEESWPGTCPLMQGCPPTTSLARCGHECPPRLVPLAYSSGSFQWQLCSEGCRRSSSSSCSMHTPMAAKAFRSRSLGIPGHDPSTQPVCCTAVVRLCGWC